MATASVTPNNVTPGSNINVVVVGFAPYAHITITVNQTGGHATSILLTDIYGNGTFTFGPFSDPAGAYTLTVTDGTHTVTGVGYTVGSAALVSVLPISIYSGDNIEVIVSGFLPNHTIRISAGNWYTNQTTNSSGGGVWSIGPITGSGQYTLTASDGTNSATAGFNIQTQTVNYTLTLSANGSGSVMNSPTGTSFAQNTLVTLVATSNPGASFTGWYEGSNLLSTNLSYVITMNANRTIVGVFTSSATVTVTPTSIVQNVTKITVAVTNFKPSSSIFISVVGGGGWSGTTGSTGGGTFTDLGPFGDSLGDHILRVTDGVSTIDTTITITSTGQTGYTSLTMLAVTSP
jgi:hypothetical protein